MGSKIYVSCRCAKWVGHHYVADFDYLISSVKDIVAVLDLFGYSNIKTTLDNNMTFRIDIDCDKPLLMNHYYAIEDRFCDELSFYYANRDEFENWELGIEPDNPEEGMEKD